MKIMACDFDGTLYVDGVISPRDREAIEKFRREGNLFGMCTGRWPGRNFRQMYELTGDMDFYVISSGAMVLDGDRKVIWEKGVPTGQLRPFVEFCRSEIGGRLPAFGALNSRLQIRGAEQWEEKKAEPGKVKHEGEKTETVSEEEFYARNETIYTFFMQFESEARASEVAKMINDREAELGVTAHQNTYKLDIVAGGCTKGEGLRRVREHFGFDGDIAAIGDSFNDLAMLESTPMSFSFHRAPGAVREKAAYLVDSVAEALELLEKM